MTKVIVITSNYRVARNICEMDLHIPLRDRANVWVFTDENKMRAWIPYPGDEIIAIRPDHNLWEYAKYRMARRPGIYNLDTRYL